MPDTMDMLVLDDAVRRIAADLAGAPAPDLQALIAHRLIDPALAALALLDD